MNVYEELVLPKAQNVGIKVDPANPTYQWADLKGLLIVDTSGTTAPTIEIYKTGVEDYGYNSSDKLRWKFHLEHGEVVGGNKYIHPHLEMVATAFSGNLVLTHVIAHCYGHSRTNSPAPITIVQTIAATSMPAGKNYIPDVLFAKTGGGAGLLNSSNMLPDDHIYITTTVTTFFTAVSGGTSQKLFMPFCDIHREVTGMQGTKNKDPIDTGSFYQ